MTQHQDKNQLCGMFSWYPRFLQRFATTRSFIGIYGILGIFQAMGYIYFVITLQTIEKRFKIPSQTTGLILSGNEISQILLSVILAYIGGKSNRPRFIAIGSLFCALSCFILSAPHFIYGAGSDALKLTKEYADATNSSHIDDSIARKMDREANRLCIEEESSKECDDEIKSILPLVLIFLSQFVLGIGNTLFFALGQTYLDDGVRKKKNTSMYLAIVFSLRTFGPAVGFVLGFACLKMYIDPTKTPLIDSSDPRWMGAYWLGWVFIGIAMFIVSFFIGLFPREMPKQKSTKDTEKLNGKDAINKKNLELIQQEGLALKGSMTNLDFVGSSADMTEIPATADKLFETLLRLFKNKLLMYNTISAIFYILGASAYFTYMSKYMEVQFHKNAADATIISGPLTLLGMVAGFLGSGLIITKKKPSPSKILLWNVFVGLMFMVGEISYLFLTCPDGQIPLEIHDGKLNLSSACNNDCHCSNIPYTPVCLEETGDTFFSPCVASCGAYDKKKKLYYQCECSKYHLSSITPRYTTSTLPYSAHVSTSKPIDFTTTNYTIGLQKLPITESQFTSAGEGVNDVEYDYEDETLSTLEGSEERHKRAVDDEDTSFWGKMTPGACTQGCAFGFFTFSIISSIINCFGTSARIGNVLINFRCVSVKDKSVTQGLILMLISLFALIPGPIMYGRIIDETCIVWSEHCSGRKGNCQLYDQKLFRYYVNLTALCLTTIGVFFDFLVWKNGRNLDLYGEREDEMTRMKEKKETNGVKK